MSVSGSFDAAACHRRRDAFGRSIGHTGVTERSGWNQFHLEYYISIMTVLVANTGAPISFSPAGPKGEIRSEFV
ncbi:hypothetical protein ABD05_22825 [Burkholderia pyrrocinia]|nr:hypothetical protein ABD05_22825 [Burkholderia pyrrocinia]